VVAVSLKLKPRFWAAHVPPVAARHLVAQAGQAASLPYALQDFGVSDVLHRIKCPVLVVGAGQDRLIPSSEAMHVAASLGDLATMIWYEQSGHCAYDQVDDWMEVAAQWLAGAFGFEEELQPAPQSAMPSAPREESTQVESPFSTPPPPIAPAVLSTDPAPRTPAEEDVVISVDPAARPPRSDLEPAKPIVPRSSPDDEGD